VIEHEATHEGGISRRRFLQFGAGLLGGVLRALTLPSLGWSESAQESSGTSAQEPWLEAHKQQKAKKGKGTKKGAHKGSKKAAPQTADLNQDVG
jgi:hypothetical protein